MKRETCKCDICWAYAVAGRPKKHSGRHGYNWYAMDSLVTPEKGTVVGSCLFCKNTNVFLGFPIHPTLKEALGISRLCWECKRLANRFIRQKYGLCYFKNHPSEIELAVLDMLQYCLLGEIAFTNGTKFSTNTFWAIRKLGGLYNSPEPEHEPIISRIDFFDV